MFFIESVLVSQSCVTLCDPMIFPTQGSNPGFLHCSCILYQLSYQGRPRFYQMHLFILSRKQIRSYYIGQTPVSQSNSHTNAQHSISYFRAVGREQDGTTSKYQRRAFTLQGRNPEIINLGVYRGILILLPFCPPERERETSHLPKVKSYGIQM